MNGLEGRTAMVSAVLEARDWRSLSAEQLVRLVLAARDRHRVESLLMECLGTITGSWHDLEPVSRLDVRVAPLTDHLTAQLRLRADTPNGALPQSTAEVVGLLLSALDRWWFRWQWRLGDDTVTRDSD